MRPNYKTFTMIPIDLYEMSLLGSITTNKSLIIEPMYKPYIASESNTNL